MGRTEGNIKQLLPVENNAMLHLNIKRSEREAVAVDSMGMGRACRFQSSDTACEIHEIQIF